MYWYLVWLMATVNLFFDGYYFFWNILCLAKCGLIIRLTGYMDLFGTLRTWGVCWCTDLDYLGHMNNSRYLRNADINRLEFVMRTGMLRVIRECGAQMLLGASTIRYRKSLQPLDLYSLHCRVLCWDEKAFYFEHRYVRCTDNFICAIAILKAAVVGITPDEVVQKMLGKKTPSPEFPEELKPWIECNNISSQKLRKDL